MGKLEKTDICTRAPSSESETLYSGTEDFSNGSRVEVSGCLLYTSPRFFTPFRENEEGRAIPSE